MTTPQRLDVNGVDVAYRRAGSGPPLLYLHGMGLTRRWLELYAVLAERFDVIVPEHPGFGDTARPAWYRSLDDFVPHYADLLDALKLDEAHVVGHSLGAVVAAAFSATYPERVRSLTLITPGPLPLASPGFDEPDDIPADFDFDGILFNDNQAAYPEYRNGDDEGLVIAPNDGDEHADPSAWSLDVTPTLYRRLARVRGPAQVLVPDEDRLFSNEIFAAWARWLGDMPVVRIPGRTHPTGHLLIVQEPQAIAARIGELAHAAQEARA
ncbi:alpha/beta fold hydrolase [Capillimicrobium parvum]|nr:alpha/beta hydrolase [Capillimicrobium parvum]